MTVGSTRAAARPPVSARLGLLMSNQKESLFLWFRVRL